MTLGECGLRDYGTGMWAGGDQDCDHLGQPHRTQAGFNERYFGRESGTDKQGELREPFRDVCGRCGAQRVDGQLGLEATPDLYVERMVGVFREVWRVLRDDGTVWINLGDSYASGEIGRHDGYNPTRANGSTTRKPFGDRKQQRLDTGLKPKDLVGIPWRVAFALQADGWYLRSDIIWSKPNPMPESVSDRPTKAHEYLFLLSKQPRYFYDADAIREPLSPSSFERWGDDPYTKRDNGGEYTHTLHPHRGYGEGNMGANPAGRNRRSVWVIPTEPFPEAHFATYPQALVRPCILAGTSERGECVVCGAPWVREVERGPAYPGAGWGDGRQSANEMINDGERRSNMNGALHAAWKAEHPDKVIGWRPSCGCDARRAPRAVSADSHGYEAAGASIIPQTVLDPFIGSGTTALVARNHGRRCIGIDLSESYLTIAAKRLSQLSLLAGAPPG